MQKIRGKQQKRFLNTSEIDTKCCMIRQVYPNPPGSEYAYPDSAPTNGYLFLGFFNGLDGQALDKLSKPPSAKTKTNKSPWYYRNLLTP